jgi:cytochrome c2
MAYRTPAAVVAGLLAGWAMAAAAAPPAGDPVHGKQVFAARCGLCHSAGPDEGEAGQGPPLGGVVGRTAATAPGFEYTAALKNSHLVWTPANLDTWLAGPSKMVPGTAMPIAVADAKTRADLIAYLATVKRP